MCWYIPDFGVAGNSPTTLCPRTINSISVLSWSLRITLFRMIFSMMSSLKDKTTPDCRTWFWYKLGREIEPAQAVPISRPDCPIQDVNLDLFGSHPPFHRLPLSSKSFLPLVFQRRIHCPWRAYCALHRTAYPLWSVIPFSRCGNGLLPADPDKPDRSALTGALLQNPAKCLFRFITSIMDCQRWKKDAILQKMQVILSITIAAIQRQSNLNDT